MVTEFQSAVYHPFKFQICNIRCFTCCQPKRIIFWQAFTDFSATLRKLDFGIIPQSFCRRETGFGHFFIASATAKIAVQSFVDFLLCQKSLIQQGPDFHDDSRCAESALQTTFYGKGIDHRFFFFRIQSLHRDDFFSCNTSHRCNTGFEYIPIQQDCTASTNSFWSTTVFW